MIFNWTYEDKLYIHTQYEGRAAYIRWEEKRDMFVVLRWKDETKSLEETHVPFNPLPKRDRGVAKRYGDDYNMNLFP